MGGKNALRVGQANQFMELQQIDGVRLEALEGLIKCLVAASPVRPSILVIRKTLLAVAVSQGLAHADFACAAVVIPRIVHEVNAVVDGGADDAEALRLIRPAEVITAQTNDGDLLTRAAQLAVGDLAFFRGRLGLGDHPGNPRRSRGHSQSR